MYPAALSEHTQHRRQKNNVSPTQRSKRTDWLNHTFHHDSTTVKQKKNKSSRCAVTDCSHHQFVCHKTVAPIGTQYSTCASIAACAAYAVSVPQIIRPVASATDEKSSRLGWYAIPARTGVVLSTPVLWVDEVHEYDPFGGRSAQLVSHGTGAKPKVWSRDQLLSLPKGAETF